MARKLNVRFSSQMINIWIGVIVMLVILGTVPNDLGAADDVAETLTESVVNTEIQDIVNYTTNTVGSVPLKFTVYATREGLVGGTTANGHVIVSHDHFVALPSRRVLCSNGGHEYEVKVSYNGKSVIAPVWDVGPWNEKDNYWDPPSQREMWKDLPQGMPEAQAARDKETYPPDGYNGGCDETNYLVKVSTGSDDFSVGDRVRPTINGLAVRETAGGNKEDTVSTSDRGTVKEGPKKVILGSFYYRWWKIEWDDGPTGWSAQKRYVSNPAGIDLADGIWEDLGMTNNDWVTVEFLWTSAGDSVDKGLQWLRDHQNPIDGSWAGDYGANVGYTSLAALAFLNAGFDESDPTVSKAMNYILSKKHGDGSIYVDLSNYETSLAILPLVATHNSSYNDEIIAAKNYLVSIQNNESAGIDETSPWYGGWAYIGLDSDWSDLSNTQWTMMGLDAANLPKSDSTWSKAETFVTRCQNLEANPWHFSNDGGFGYQPPNVSCCGRHISYGSMTAAGIWGLRLAGVPTGDQRIQAGLNWLKDNYAPIETKGNSNCPHGSNWMLYYHLLGFAKALVMTDIPVGGWQDTASQAITNYIVSQQYDDGHWTTSSEGDVFATEQAILALQTRTIPTDIKRLSWMTLILHSNADLHVYDPLGRHVGKNYGTGGVDLEIPNATYSYNGEQNIRLPELESGNYRIVLIGTGVGEYTLNITGRVGNDTVSEDSYTGNITPGEVHESTVNVAMITGLTIHVEEPEPIDAMVLSATGTGNVSIISDAGVIEDFVALSESDMPEENPNVDFPHGLFRFNITGINPGQIVNITLAFPQDISTTAQYWICGPNGSINNPQPVRWYVIPMDSNDGDNIITITKQDGGIGDEDGIANGVIVDDGGPGLPLQQRVPILTPTGLVALVSLLSAIAAVTIVRKRR